MNLTRSTWLLLADRAFLILRHLAAGGTLAVSVGAGAQTTALADKPIFVGGDAPNNLSMVLSVEFPTAVSVAYGSRTYVAASTYLGYFDPAKCYSYVSSSTDTPSKPGTTAASYFSPSAKAALASDGVTSTHICSKLWSGNFLNWAGMQTIDTFRWVLTGGYRVIDTASTSVVEKAWATGQGGTGNFPDSTLAAADIAGATPFGSLSATGVNMRIQGMGNRLRLMVAQPYNVAYYNSTDLSGTAVLTRNEPDTSSIQDNTSPGPGVNTYNYSARFVTTVVAPTTGSYSFATVSDDGARMYLTGGTEFPTQTKIIDSWPSGGQSPTNAYSAAITLTAGVSYTVTTEYRQFGGGAKLLLGWQTPGSTSYVAFPGPTLYTTATNYPSDLPGGGTSAVANTPYDLFMRVKLCDATVSLESNCTAYAGGFKPEGLLQQYANKLRYSAFGYLNDDTSTRDAGVLRAAQKFIGPLTPVYAAQPTTNLAAEWDATSGIIAVDPDCSASNPDKPIDPASPEPAACPAITNRSSGVINYINKFGLYSHHYKTYDPVSELYYAAIRYFKNLGNVPQWSTLPGSSTSSINQQMDGFPVISTWIDPIMPGGSCQRNFILGIGDTHTWLDKDVSGNPNTTTSTNGEPSPLPPLVSTDPSPTNAYAATTQIGAMEGLGTSFGTKSPYGSCCTGNSALIAGLAYDAHTTGIRTYKDLNVTQTLDTYWLDVQEGGHYEPNNQFYLAAKYGGFTVPTGFQPYANTSPLPTGSWESSPADTLTYGSVSNTRPKNYYSAGRPDQMQAGLINAFQNAAVGAPTNSTSFAVSIPQVTSAGTDSYAASYVPASWTGDVSRYTLTLDSTGTPSLSAATWSFATQLGTQAAGNGWDSGRKIVTWSGTAGVPFRVAGTNANTGITSAQLNTLDTSYVAGVDSTNYLNYLRGDRTYEIPATGTASSTQAYRTRASLVGDIVDSKPVVVANPPYPYSDNTNPGYASFKATTRNTVVYVGANDGMLHAINAADGTELFAYIPAALFNGPSGTPNTNGLASLGNPLFVHHNMVDGPMDYFDVDFGRVAGASTSAPNDWHTLLIGSLGKGGKSYYALDVTSPSSIKNESTAAATVKWEYSNSSALGYTYGTPVVAKTRQYGWVVILPSGYNNGDGVGHLLFLNPKTGALLTQVDMPAGSTGLAQINAFVPDPTDMTIDAIYGGDLAGNVWRVDVTQTTGSSYPAPVKMAQLTDAAGGAGQPVTTYPLIQIDPSTSAQRRFVLIATGRLLDTSDITSSQIQSFYALWDGGKGFGAFSSPKPPGGTSFPITRSALKNIVDTDTPTLSDTLDLSGFSGWVEDLSTVDPKLNSSSSIRQRVVTPLTATYGEVAFATTIPNVAMCSQSGASQTYALAFGSAQSVLLNPDDITKRLAYVPLPSTPTETSFFSNNGQSALLQGGPVKNVPIAGLSNTNPRRVNWRELPMVD